MLLILCWAGAITSIDKILAISGFSNSDGHVRIGIVPNGLLVPLPESLDSDLGCFSSTQVSVPQCWNFETVFKNFGPISTVVVK